METLFKISNLGAGIIRERIRKYHIDADFVPGYGYLAYNQRQLKTLQQWEKEFKAATPEDDIELYTGKDVQQVIGSDVYCGVLKHMGRACPLAEFIAGLRSGCKFAGVKIFEYSPVVEVSYGKTVRVRTAMGSVKRPNCCGPVIVFSIIWNQKFIRKRWLLILIRSLQNLSPASLLSGSVPCAGLLVISAR